MKLFLLCVYSVLVFFPSVSLAAGDVAVLESIRFGGEKEGKSGEIITFQLDREVVPRVFALDGGNPRMVFDFMETIYSPHKEKSIAAEGEIVKRIRVGLHREPVIKTRVVIDLAEHTEVTVEKEYRPLQKTLVVRVLSRKDSLERVSAVENDEDRDVPQPPREDVPQSPQEEKQALFPVTVDPFATIAEERASVAVAAAVAESAVPEVPESVTPPRKAGDGGDPVAAVTGKDQIPEHVLSAGGDDEKSVQDPISPVLPPLAVSTEDLQALVKVQFERTTNNKEMVLFHLNGFFPPVIFAIEEETPKIVCDFFDARLGSGIRPTIESGGTFISRVRVAEHEDPVKVRVVLDLVAGRNYDLKQVFFKEDNLFVVILGDN